MGKQPGFYFYPNDWIGDNQLQMCSESTRGIWINLLCKMWWSPERGSVTGTKEELCRLGNCSAENLERFFQENSRHRFAEVTMDPCVTEASRVTERIEKVTVLNRRMLREEKARKSHASRQAKYRAGKSDAKVTTLLPSTPLPSTPSTSNTLPPISPPHRGTAGVNGFNQLWALHPGPKGPKKDALQAYSQAKPPETAVEAMRHQLAYKAECDKRGIFCANLPHLHRWIKKRRWEDEIPALPGIVGAKPEPAADPKSAWKGPDEYHAARAAGRVPPSMRVKEWENSGDPAV